MRTFKILDWCNRSQYLYPTNTEENNQNLNEPGRHQFVKHKQEAW